MDLVESPKLSPKTPEVFSLPEIEALLASIPLEKPEGLRDRTLFELIYSAGLRVSEAVSLSVDKLYLGEVWCASSARATRSGSCRWEDRPWAG